MIFSPQYSEIKWILFYKLVINKLNISKLWPVAKILYQLNNFKLICELSNDNPQTNRIICLWIGISTYKYYFSTFWLEGCDPSVA